MVRDVEKCFELGPRDRVELKGGALAAGPCEPVLLGGAAAAGNLDAEWLEK